MSKKELVLEFGCGELEVMQGCYDDRYSLIIGKNGNGVVGESISKDRFLNDNEVLTAFKFSNLQSLNVVIEMLNQLKYNMENKLPYYVKNEYGEIIQTIKPKIE